MGKKFAVAVIGAIVFAPAMIGPAAAKDRTSYQAISTGNFAQAERDLIAERRIFPDRPELMLNLAAVYARTGRVAEARSMYEAALAAPAVDLDIADGAVATSHDVARAGQAMLAKTVVAAR